MRDREPIETLLRKGDWFRNLPPALQSLIVARATVRRHRKGESILREGLPAKGLFVVLDGCVRIVRSVGDAKEVLLAVAESGFWFGDYSTLMGGAPSVTSIIAKAPMRTLFLSAADFERIIRDEPRYFRDFARMTIGRYGLLYRYVAEAAGLPREDWLRARLVDLAAVRRNETSATGPVTLNVSQAELASMVGVSRETLRTLLVRLKERGLIEIGFRNIRVLE